MRPTRFLAPILMLCAILNVSLPLSAQAAPPDRTTLPGSAPAWANAKNFAGDADPAGYVGFRVYLGWSDPSAVAALAQGVSDPRNAAYRQFLTPAKFRQQFSRAGSGRRRSGLVAQPGFRCSIHADE